MPVGIVIVAAGRSERFGGDTPKPLIEVGGRSVLQRSVAAFDGLTDVAGMVVVLPAALVARGEALVGPTRHVCRYVAGGARRQDSVRAGVRALPDTASLVLVHDAARPFVQQALIERVIAAARRTGAAVPAVQARDTVKRVPAGGAVVTETLARDEIWLAQTPQGFTRRVLDAAVALGETDREATDEATLAERAGQPVEVVPGDERNIKITTPDDLLTARHSARETPRIGTGYDLHRLVVGRPLVLAGIVVPFDRGPFGHSDGDVICHSLVDALLGGVAAGNVGSWFPDTDAAWKGAPGLDLLGRAVGILAERGWRPAGVDVVVLLERPKLAPHLSEIRGALAAVLGVPVDRVSVKGKTNEGVDAVGRGEAIAAHAVAVLEPR